MKIMKRMNMLEEQKSKLFYLGIFPKCPFYGKPVSVLIILVLIALGTWGIYYLNLWAAVGYLIYSVLFYFLIMPLTMCKYCYYKVKETTIDKEKGKTSEKLLSVDKWSESYLHKHVGQKHWTWLMTIVWLLPIVLIVISFFANFSIFALISLIGFMVVLAGNWLYMLRVKCPTCAIRDECHSSF
jgi:membrane protein YdbS with pleckstrin-like domain